MFPPDCSLLDNEGIAASVGDSYIDLILKDFGSSAILTTSEGKMNIDNWSHYGTQLVYCRL
jgi:hypothetical protein